MSNRSFFWKCLETRLGPIRGPVWEVALQEEFPLGRRYLVPVSVLATKVACERNRQTGCNYRVVDHLDGSFVGICDQGYCPRRPLDRSELIRYEPQDQKITEEIGRLLGLLFNPVRLKPPGASLFLANLPGAAAVQILYIRHSNAEDFRTFVEEQILADRPPFILLSPTLRHMTPDVAGLLQRRQCRTLALDGDVILGPRGFTATDRFLSVWKDICAAYAPAIRPSILPDFVGAATPAPDYALICEGATWRIHFRGDTFSARHAIGFDQLAHLLIHWQHAFDPIEARQLVDPRELGQTCPNGESRETEGSSETASAEAILRIKRQLQKLGQEAAENEGHEAALHEIAHERDTLEHELIRITTPDGRVRREGGTMDKARKSVSNNIYRVLKRVAQNNKACARHLTLRLSLGFSMTYTPDFGEEWVVKFRPKK